MLAGRPTSSFALFTALTASPNDALGARLNESVITGNWPWWFTVMGTAWVSRWVNAFNGTWPPVGNIAEDAMAPPPNPEFAGVAPEALAPVLEPALADPDADPAAAEPLAAEPPATTPAAALGVPVPRIKRLRRSIGFCRNEGLTSSTT